ncbi:hypothetical protein [Saccharothrix deserti]|uniref:hypothetical protein n=1 Tax=Saccharothrix deserti TaxID=2593674 RepID=UPI00131BDA7E|nr:hypothetical protein [Saccharothrix deserti]
MILGPRELDWQRQVLDTARRAGWTTYVQDLRNERSHEPSVVLVRATRVVLVFLRTNVRRAHETLPGRFAELHGVECYLWAPRDWPRIRILLTTAPSTAEVIPSDQERL